MAPATQWSRTLPGLTIGFSRPRKPKWRSEVQTALTGEALGLGWGFFNIVQQIKLSAGKGAAETRWGLWCPQNHSSVWTLKATLNGE